jgi:hypothetical protein
MRLVCGTNGTLPLAVAKIAKVGVALALIVVVTLEPIDEMHWPLVGSVWQRLIASGKLAAPVLVVAVIAALAPTFTVATAKAFEPLVPVMCRMPSFCSVAASATMSGTGVAEPDSNNVLKPVLLGAAPSGPAAIPLGTWLVAGIEYSVVATDVVMPGLAGGWGGLSEPKRVVGAAVRPPGLRRADQSQPKHGSRGVMSRHLIILPSPRDDSIPGSLFRLDRAGRSPLFVLSACSTQSRL